MGEIISFAKSNPVYDISAHASRRGIYLSMGLRGVREPQLHSLKQLTAWTGCKQRDSFPYSR